MTSEISEGSPYLFVCSGNTCRSPMAEYLFKGRAAKEGIDIEAFSRGTGVFGNKDQRFELLCARETYKLVNDMYPGSWIFTHIPTQITLRDVANSRTILTMEEYQRDNILRTAKEFIPGLAKRVFSIKEYAGIWDVDLLKELNVKDPLGGATSSGGGYVGQWSGGWSGASGFSNDVEDDSRVIGFSSADSKSALGSTGVVKSIGPDKDNKDVKVNSYVECRDDLLACFDRIFSGTNPSVDDIMNRRRDAYSLRVEERKAGEHKRNLSDLTTVYNVVNRASGGWDVEVDKDIYKLIIEDSVSQPREIRDEISDILELAERKKVNLVERKAYGHASYLPAASSTSVSSTSVSPKRNVISRGKRRGPKSGGQSNLPEM